VVPYRHIAGELQILIITSSKNKHWVIPKGICDPGMTAQQSAAKEAYEEAGVQGEVLDGKIGYYQYPKWDAVCEVSVYPMRVNQLLDNDQWQESHRQRQWVSVQQAVSQLKNPDIKGIVATLPDWLEQNG
jgi:phosphohistidine phosphatase